MRLNKQVILIYLKALKSTFNECFLVSKHSIFMSSNLPGNSSLIARVFQEGSNNPIGKHFEIRKTSTDSSLGTTNCIALYTFLKMVKTNASFASPHNSLVPIRNYRHRKYTSSNIVCYLCGRDFILKLTFQIKYK